MPEPMTITSDSLDFDDDRDCADEAVALDVNAATARQGVGRQLGGDGGGEQLKGRIVEMISLMALRRCDSAESKNENFAKRNRCCFSDQIARDAVSFRLYTQPCCN
jgi:hypothetical protein